jgi:hypothetical protein
LKSCRRITVLREMEIGPRFLKVIWERISAPPFNVNWIKSNLLGYLYV